MTTMYAANTLLRRHEGYRRFPYRDTVGKLTVGYGLNLEDRGLSESEARFLLDNEIDRINLLLGRKYPWYNTLTPYRRAVCIDMVYNLGEEGFDKFHKLKAALAAGRWREARMEMLNSKWATQVGSRATRLADIMQTNELPEDLK